MLNFKFKDGRTVDVKYPIILHDANGNLTYSENSDGYYFMYRWDNNGNKTYYENSYGTWTKYEYDGNGNCTYWKDSEGRWSKHEFDEKGVETYFEDAKGDKRGISREVVEMTMAEIEKLMGKKVNVIK